MTDDKWRSMVLDCGEYLKEGETPAERIDREIKDCLSMMKMLEKEKRKSEALAAERDALAAEVERLSEALLVYGKKVRDYTHENSFLSDSGYDWLNEDCGTLALSILEEEEENEMSPVKDREDYEV